MTKHTPGPWEAKGMQLPHERTVISIQGGCVVSHTYGDNEAIRNANARLIAAAPDLLSAAERALLTMDTVEVTEGGVKLVNLAMTQLRAAIARARGEE